MKTTFITAACVACLLSVACHGADLSRAEAKKILETNGAWTTIVSGREVAAKEVNIVSFTSEQMSTLNTFWATQPTLNQYVKGWQQCPNFGVSPSITCENPAGEGANVEERMQRAQYGGLGGGVTGTVVMLKTPVKLVVVEVTGISEAQNHFGGGEGPNVKTVEYTWLYDLPKEVVPAGLLLPHEGKAILRRYDDGWRLDKFMRWGAAANPTGWSR